MEKRSSSNSDVTDLIIDTQKLLMNLQCQKHIIIKNRNVGEHEIVMSIKEIKNIT